MRERDGKLSTSTIKYLLALYELDKNGIGARSIDIADKLKFSTILFLCDTESEEDLQGAAKAIKSQYHIVTREERLAEYDKRENNRN